MISFFFLYKSKFPIQINFIKKKQPEYLTQKKLAILHCNASYPTPLVDCNLGSINFLKKNNDKKTRGIYFIHKQF